jgi:hypothetical protein
LQTDTRKARSGRLCDGLYFDMEAEPEELSDVVPGFDLGRAAIEMIGTEVVMVRPILQQVVDRCKH